MSTIDRIRYCEFNHVSKDILINGVASCANHTRSNSQIKHNAIGNGTARFSNANTKQRE